MYKAKVALQKRKSEVQRDLSRPHPQRTDAERARKIGPKPRTNGRLHKTAPEGRTWGEGEGREGEEGATSPGPLPAGQGSPDFGRCRVGRGVTSRPPERRRDFRPPRWNGFRHKPEAPICGGLRDSRTPGTGRRTFKALDLCQKENI
ncbi:lysosomal enzyme trafficking factor isoform X3 [Notamacropus eugenii]|uniref:lysosomal enzyme trafficking factor isoform X3 n=1 Tax=Notamacropus eugenii TaxID=9315 RepID=UPI003B67DADA